MASNGNGKSTPIFVNTNSSNEARSATNKRLVRSTAALASWPGRRRRIPREVDQPSNDNAPISEQRPTFIGVFSSGAMPPAIETRVPKGNAAVVVLADRHGGLEAIAAYSCETDEKTPFEELMRDKDPAYTSVRCRKRVRYSPRKFSTNTEGVSSCGSLHGEKRTMAGDPGVVEHLVNHLSITTRFPSSAMFPSAMVNNSSEAVQPGRYPAAYIPWFDRLLHHMITDFGPQFWPTLGITDEEGLAWGQFITQHALVEPALFYARLLFASGDLIRLEAIPPEVTYFLKSQASRAINDALSDPARAISDANILAVERVALHETLYGDRDAARVMHRPALKRMIEMRGGMMALPFSHLIKRLMRLADQVMAALTGTEPMLENGEKFQDYTLREAIAASDKWVPGLGQEVRRKLKVARAASTGLSDMLHSGEI